MGKQQLADKHSVSRDMVFRFKTYLLTANRVFKNALAPTKKFKDERRFIDSQVLAFSESELWNPLDNDENWILTAGKIENLRVAARKLHGLEVKANEVFSFWKHIGNPSVSKGYVIGREIREGCVVPTTAGGLCQLSNALYDAALNANFEIIERHKHTRIIQGSLAEQDRDATVKWNYVDLRFKSSFDFRIEVKLTESKLIVSYKSEQKSNESTVIDVESHSPDKVNDCYSCGNTSCFKHFDKAPKRKSTAKTTFILDEKWPEFDDYVTSVFADSDQLIVPFKKNRFIKTNRYNWTVMKAVKVSFISFQGFYRAIKLRCAPKNKNNVFELMLSLDDKIAKAAIRKIPIDSTHIIISQNLLPFIYETGALGGRTFDVLMTRYPFYKLHEKLDLASAQHPESETLNDFRVPSVLIELENTALNKARKIITSHAGIAEIFKYKVEKLPWLLPLIAINKSADKNQTNAKENNKDRKVLFPASAVGRKGAYEMKQLVEALSLDLAVLGRNLEGDNFWQDIQVERFNGNYDQVALVVYPTHIEHQPRHLLKMIAMGIPVITTTACGIESADCGEFSNNVKVLGVQDLSGFKDEIQKVLNAD